jgi:hypothetical protein
MIVYGLILCLRGLLRPKTEMPNTVLLLLYIHTVLVIRHTALHRRGIIKLIEHFLKTFIII